MLSTFASSFLVATTALSAGSFDVQTDPALTMASVPVGAQRVLMLTIAVTNTTGETATLRTLTLHHEGLGDSQDLLRVYAVDVHGVRRTSAAGAAKRDGTVRLRMTPPLPVGPGEAVALRILADTSPQSGIGAEHRIAVDAVNELPVRAPRIPEGRAAIRSVPAPVGIITVTELGVPRAPRYGEYELVGRLRLRADRADDHRIRSILLTNDGSARGTDLQNLALFTNRGQRVSGIMPSLHGPAADQVLLELTPPLLLGKNDELILNLRADVRARRSRTIRFLVAEPGDIAADVVRGR